MPPFRIMKMSLFFLFQIHIMDKSYIIAFWSPIQTLHPQFCLDYFIPLLQKFGDIQCIDFQSRQDPRTMHLLQQADLVVIGLPADSAYFILFSVNTGFPFPMYATQSWTIFHVCSKKPITCVVNTAFRNSLFWDSHTMLIFWKHCDAESLFSGIVSQSRLLFPQRKTSVFFSQN